MDTDAHGSKTRNLSVFICVNLWLESSFSGACKRRSSCRRTRNVSVWVQHSESQNRNFSATWAMRGLRAEVILPKLAFVTLPLGLLNWVWLKALKNSKRN